MRPSRERENLKVRDINLIFMLGLDLSIALPISYSNMAKTFLMGYQMYLNKCFEDYTFRFRPLFCGYEKKSKYLSKHVL